MVNVHETFALRVRRLNELVEVSAPEELIAQEVLLVMDASLNVMPHLLFEALATWLNSKIEQEANYSANKPRIAVSPDEPDGKEPNDE